MQGHTWESYEAILWPPFSASERIYHRTRNTPVVEERSGEGLNPMTSNMKARGSKLHDQQYARGGKVTLGARFHPIILVSLFFHC